MFRLAECDIEILTILWQEGRISKSALAKRVNLSNSPSWERLRRLEKAAIITGYGAHIAQNRTITELLESI